MTEFCPKHLRETHSQSTTMDMTTTGQGDDAKT